MSRVRFVSEYRYHHGYFDGAEREFRGFGMVEQTDSHDGEEFAYVLKGELLYVIDGQEFRLGPGDSMHLRSNVPHLIHNDGDEVTVVVSVLTPRLF